MSYSERRHIATIHVLEALIHTSVAYYADDPEGLVLKAHQAVKEALNAMLASYYREA